MKYDMIIFDIDGTLWDVSENALEAYNRITKRYPEINKVSMEKINAIMGLGLEGEAKFIMPNIDLDKAIRYVKLQIKESMKLISKNGAHIYDGIIETIKKLSKTYKLGIVTNSLDNYAELFLEKSNLKNYFTDYIGAGSYNLTKSEAIKQIIKRNNIKTACYIGDIKKDMIAAKEAGIDFIHARYGFEKKPFSDLYIDDIKELEELLKKIRGKIYENN